MSYAERHTVSVTTIADGSATAYSPVVTGKVVEISYIKDTFVDGVDFTITAEVSGASLWTDTNINASEVVAPVQVANINTTGAASTLTEVPVYLAQERVKIVIAQGGNVGFGSKTNEDRRYLSVPFTTAIHSLNFIFPFLPKSTY